MSELASQFVLDLGRRLNRILTPGRLGFILIVTGTRSGAEAELCSNIRGKDVVRVMEEILAHQKKELCQEESATSALTVSKPVTGQN